MAKGDYDLRIDMLGRRNLLDVACLSFAYTAIKSGDDDSIKMDNEIKANLKKVTSLTNKLLAVRREIRAKKK